MRVGHVREEGGGHVGTKEGGVRGEGCESAG